MAYVTEQQDAVACLPAVNFVFEAGVGVGQERFVVDEAHKFVAVEDEDTVHPSIFDQSAWRN